MSNVNYKAGEVPWIELEDAFDWLTQFEQPQLSLYSDECLSQLTQAVEDKRHSQALGLMDMLEKYSRRLTNEAEKAYVLADCGYLAVHLGEAERAIRLLRRAVDAFTGHPHQAAVSMWLLGQVLLSMDGKLEEGIGLWQESMQAFIDLAKRRTLPAGRREWYAGQQRRMAECFSYVVRNHGLPESQLRRFAWLQAIPASAPFTPAAPQPEASGASFTPPPGPPKPPRAVTRENLGWLQAAYLSSLPVIDQIPAGGFGPSGVNTFALEFGEVRRMSFEGQEYEFFSLNRSRVVSMSPGVEHFVLKVTGDSMDKTGIEPGDYVLLRRQEQAEDGDIVAAGVEDFESSATLKLYTRQGRTIILKPHSNNTTHSEFTFSAEDKQRLKIYGIVVGVFKPVN